MTTWSAALTAETARLYAEANQAAVELVANRVKQYNIDCDFLRAAAYTYTTDAQEVQKIRGGGGSGAQGGAAGRVRA